MDKLPRSRVLDKLTMRLVLVGACAGYLHHFFTTWHWMESFGPAILGAFAGLVVGAWLFNSIEDDIKGPPLPPSRPERNPGDW